MLILYALPQGVQTYPTQRPLIGGTLNIKHVRAHWDDILRLASSIKQGTVTASLMLRKLGRYPRQNGLAVALREPGRIERTLFILDRLQSVELRRRVLCRAEQGRGAQLAGQGCVLQPSRRNPRPQFRAAALL